MKNRQYIDLQLAIYVFKKLPYYRYLFLSNRNPNLKLPIFNRNEPFLLSFILTPKPVISPSKNIICNRKALTISHRLVLTSKIINKEKEGAVQELLRICGGRKARTKIGAEKRQKREKLNWKFAVAALIVAVGRAACCKCNEIFCSQM